MRKKPRYKPDDLQMIREKLRAAANASGMTQEQIGLRMGYSKDSARKAVSRLLGSTGHNPRITTVLEFCKALEVNLKDIL